MTPVNQIKRQLARFAASELSLEDFQRWLDKLDASRDSVAIQLKHAIEWQFCDAERGVVNESELLDNLEELVATPSSGTTASGVKVWIFVVPGSDDLARYFCQVMVYMKKSE